jgi:hypothetical protein
LPKGSSDLRPFNVFADAPQARNPTARDREKPQSGSAGRELRYVPFGRFVFFSFLIRSRMAAWYVAN